MELATIYELMERFSRSGLSSMELEQNGTRLKLCRETGVCVPAVPAVAAPAAPVPSPAPSSVADTTPADSDYITSPLVGAFYAAPAPDAEPFVKPGDTVKKGQTVCILEAMKAMTEIPAPMDCVIEEVLLQNGDLAAFDANLFRVRRI